MKKQTAIAIAVLAVLVILAVCLAASRGGDTADTDTAPAATEAAAASETAAAEASAEPDGTAEEPAIIEGIEVNVLEDDEIDTSALDEQYSDFTDATISLLVIP